jgi:hypothetical protein
MSDYEAEQLWNSFQVDPVGTYQAIGQHLTEAGLVTEDPRLVEMYADFRHNRDLNAYDAEVQRITSDPNADIDP